MERLMKKKRIMNSIELLFDLFYLLVMFTAMIMLFITAKISSIRFGYAFMSLILVAGDTFHLIPRMAVKLDKKGRNYDNSIGVGKLITSITMTVFYIFLWEIGLSYYAFEANTVIEIIVYGLALIRVLICLLPYNKWTEEKGSFIWGIVRNIPFVLLCIFVMAMFLIGALKIGGNLSLVWLAVFISLLCYIPVVLFYKKYPKIGMLMLPKSCAYVAIVLMGFYV